MSILSATASKTHSPSTLSPSCSSNTLAALTEYCSSSDSEDGSSSSPTAPKSAGTATTATFNLSTPTQVATPALADVVALGNRFRSHSVQEKIRRALRPSVGSGFTASRIEAISPTTPQATQVRSPELTRHVDSDSVLLASTKAIYEGIPASPSPNGRLFFDDCSVSEITSSTPVRTVIGLGLGLPSFGAELGLLSQSPLRNLRVPSPSPLPSSLSFNSLTRLEEGILSPSRSTSFTVANKLARAVRIQGGFWTMREQRGRAIVASSSVVSLWGGEEREPIYKRVLGAVGRVVSGRTNAN